MLKLTSLVAAVSIGCGVTQTQEPASHDPLREAATVTDYRNGDCVRVYRSDPRLSFTLSGVEQLHVGCLAFVASGDDALDTLGATVLVEHGEAVCTCSAL